MKKYWLFITNEDNWKLIAKKENYGFKERTKKDLDKISIGDYVLVYIKGKKIGGAFEVISKSPKVKIKFYDEEYPYQLKLLKKIIPKHPLELTKTIINKISIFTNHPRWGTLLMGRSTKEISKEDYNMIMGLI